jgi:isoquinoline 1-oxidoreductase subunit beta
MGKMKLSRRKFLIAGGLVGGGLAVTYAMSGGIPGKDALQMGADQGDFALNSWVKIGTEGQVTVAISQSEMGQGVYTSLSMLVAEELEVDLESIITEPAPINPAYANVVAIMDSLPFSDEHHKGVETTGAWAMKNVGEALGLQVTGGSTSVRNFWEPMRWAGAAARHMLISAAAEKWGVSAADCYAEKGHIKQKNGAKSANYGELVLAASQIEADDTLQLKDPKDWKVIGKSQKRLDIPAKVVGEANYGVDVDLPDMAYAAVKLCPVFGGTLASFDETAIKNMPGVIKTIKLETGVAVIADSWWRAKKAVEAMPVTFDEGENASLSSDDIFTLYRDNITKDDGRSYTDEGDTKSALSAASTIHEATYKAPFLAHATMEPMNCTVRMGDNDVEVWVANQAPTLFAWIAEQTADVPAENVKINSTLLGGGFGRRLEVDFLVMAVEIAKAYRNKPVKLVWSREQDTQHDMYRPAALSDFKATLDDNGMVTAWHNQLASPSITRQFVNRLLSWANSDMPDNTTSEGAADLPYRFNNLLMEHYPSPVPVPIGYWRSVGHSYNAFFSEGFMDELAVAAGKDPVDFRMAHLEGHKDFEMVLEKLAKAADWKTPLPKGRGRGVALHESFGSIVGQVIEVTVNDANEISIDRVVCVADCGLAVNPDGVKAQTESGIIFGLSAALYGEITLKNGRVVQENFPDYDMVRLETCPEIEVIVAPSGRPLGGAGEPGTPPVAPALMNAIFNATGERIRELPLSKSKFSA